MYYLYHSRKQRLIFLVIPRCVSGLLIKLIHVNSTFFTRSCVSEYIYHLVSSATQAFLSLSAAMALHELKYETYVDICSYDLVSILLFRDVLITRECLHVYVWWGSPKLDLSFI